MAIPQTFPLYGQPKPDEKFDTMTLIIVFDYLNLILSQRTCYGKFCIVEILPSIFFFFLRILAVIRFKPKTLC